MTTLTLTATTTGASQTVTLHRMTPSGATLDVDWGDGGAHTTIPDGSTLNYPHVYAVANTYTILITDSDDVVQIDLHDAQLSGFDTGDLASATLTYFRCYSLGSAIGSTIDSADMVGWTPTNWYLSSLPAGTYAIDSADMVGWTPTTWWLHFMPAGTYVIDSADMVGWTPTTWYLGSMPAGTYVIDSADMVGWTPTTWRLEFMPAGTYAIDSADMVGWTPNNFQLSLMPAGTYVIDSADMVGWTPTYWRLYSMPAGTYVIDSADMVGWTPTYWRLYSMPAASTRLWTFDGDDFAGWITNTSFLCHDNGLLRAQVDALLWGMYQASVVPRTAAGGTINVGGTNAAPSGVYQAAGACPVTVNTDGKEVAHELLNDGCGEGFNVWSTVTITASSAYFEQTAFRGYADDDVPGAATPKAAVNVNWSQAPDENFRIRYAVEEQDAVAAANKEFTLLYSHNGGAWTPITTTSSVIQVKTTTHYVDGAEDNNQRVGSGAFTDGELDEDGVCGDGGWLDYVGSDECEAEYCLLIVGTDVSNSDTVAVRSWPVDVFTQSPTITVVTGGPTVALDTLAIAGAALGLTVSPGAVSITLDVLTLSSIAQSLGVSPGAVQVALDTLGLVGAVGALSVAPGAVSVPLDTLALAGLAQSLGVSPGVVAVVLNLLGLTGTAQGLTIGTGVIVALDLLGLTGAAQALGVSPGAVNVALDALNITGVAQGITVLKGAVSVALDALALTGSVQPLTVSAGLTVALDALGLSGAVGSLTVVPGATTVELDALNLVAAVLALTVAAAAGLIDVEVSDALAADIAISDTLAARVAVSDALVGDVEMGDTSRT